MSNEWTTQINETIAQYHMIFLDYETSEIKNSREKKIISDRRMSCTSDPDIFACHGIDNIQLCTSCFMLQERLLEELKWNFPKTGEEYSFLPSCKKEYEDDTLNQFEKSMLELSSKYPVCTLAPDKFSDIGYPASIYKICDNKTQPDYRTCSLVVDMIFNMNRYERNKTQLDYFIALFCCTNITIFHSLLYESRDFIKGLQKDSAKKSFLRDLLNICDKVLYIREYVDADIIQKTNTDAHADFLNKFNISSSIILSLTTNNILSFIMPSLSQASIDKIKTSLAETANWNYTKDIARRGNCQTIFRDIIQKCLDVGVDFKQGNTVDTADTATTSKSSIRKDLEIAMEALKI